MKTWTSEIVNICSEDGEKLAILHQNGVIELFMLKPATKQDVLDILEVQQVK